MKQCMTESACYKKLMFDSMLFFVFFFFLKKTEKYIVKGKSYIIYNVIDPKIHKSAIKTSFKINKLRSNMFYFKCSTIIAIKLYR